MIPDEELAAWLAGEAGPAVAARVESAVAEDADLAARVEAIRRADGLLAAVPAVGPTPDAVSRITRSAMAAAAEVLDAEESAAGVSSGSRVGAGAGVRAETGAGAGAGAAGRRAGGASPGGAEDAGGWGDTLSWRGLWSTWTGRVVAAAAIVALVAAGAITMDTAGMLGADDSAESLAADDTAAEAGGSTAAGADMAGDAGATATAEARDEVAAAAPMEEMEGQTEAMSADAPEGDSDLPTSWAQLVEASQPHLLATPDGEVVVLDVGPRLDVFTAGSPGLAPVDDAGTTELVSEAVLTEWLRVALPEALPLAPGTEVGADGLVTRPEADRVLACLAAPPTTTSTPRPGVVVALVGTATPPDAATSPDGTTTSPDASGRPAVALVAANATVEVRDAETCDLLAP